MNWLQPPQEPPDDEEATREAANATDEGPELSTLNYWAHRLTPLHDPSPGYSASTEPRRQSPGKEVVFVACNRVGTESGTSTGLLNNWIYVTDNSGSRRASLGTTFAGSSAVLTMSSDPSRIELIEAFGRREEGVMFARVN